VAKSGEKWRKMVKKRRTVWKKKKRKGTKTFGSIEKTP
jgi:hypothetical protein